MKDQYGVTPLYQSQRGGPRGVSPWVSTATGFVTSALHISIGQQHPKPELLHHSERGSQYASADYQGQLREAKMIGSMSREGNCYDNAVVERVFRSLQEEGFTDHPPDTRAEATLNVIDYLTMFCNSQRLHSTLGYQSPNTFEAQAVKTDRGEAHVSTQP